ncbi:MAG TPA: transglycosylase SLT domain-containing protein [bacterium]|nr:transglycosylase SLT domain-containing protein [bacterium]
MKKNIFSIIGGAAFLCLFICNAHSAIYLYKDETNKLFLTNNLEKSSDKKFVEKSDKYKIIYANNDEISEIKQLEDKLKLLEPNEQNEFLYDKEISMAAAKYGVEFPLVKAVIKSISNFDLNFTADERFGIMGIKKEWAAEKKMPDINNAALNIEAGTMKLLDYLIKFDYDLTLALSAYYLSPEKVQEELKATGDLPKVSACRNFINSVLSNLKIYADEINESSQNMITPIKKKIIKEGGSLYLYNETNQ